MLSPKLDPGVRALLENIAALGNPPLETLTPEQGRVAAEEGIRVTCVCPGMVETEIHDRSTGDPARVERIRPNIPVKRIGRPEEIAEAIMFLLSDKASYVTGTTLRVSGGR